MADITSNVVTGNWNDVASWVGGVIPVDGDKVTIANLAVITIPSGVSVTVGDAANPTTPAIRTAGTGGTGRLIVDAGATLTLHGIVLQGNATWHIGSASGGATVIFDHASAKLTWQISDGATQANAMLWIRGASGNRSVIRKSASGVVGGGFGNLVTSWSGGGRMEASYADFSGIGDATAADAVNLLKFNSATAAQRVIFDHVKLDTCGKIIPTLAAVSVFTLDYVSIVNPVCVNNRSIQISGGTPALTTGTRHIKDSYIEGQVYIVPLAGNSADFTIERTILAGNAAAAPLYANTRFFLTDVMFYNIEATGDAGATPAGTFTRIVSLRDGAAGSDHFRTQPFAGVDLTIDGLYGEFRTVGDDYLVIGSLPTALSTITLRNAVFAPGATGTMMIPSATGADYSTLRMVAEHNTYPLIASAGTSGLVITEGNSGSAGAVLAVRSNIAWRQTSGAANLTNALASPVDGLFVGEGISHNALFNITPNAPTDLYKPSLTKYSGTPGANTLFDVDPQFTDTSRNFLTWGQSLNPVLLTWAQIVAEMARLADDAGYDSRFSISAAYTWIRTGWVPNNQALKGAAHDGGDIGAIPVIVAATPTIGISPATGVQGTAPAILITGASTNFGGSTTVSVSGAGVSVSALSAANATSCSCTFTIALGAAVGARTVTVTTGLEVVTATFTVTAAPPPIVPSGGGGGAAKQRKGYPRMPAPRGKNSLGSPLSGRPVGGGRRGR